MKLQQLGMEDYDTSVCVSMKRKEWMCANDDVNKIVEDDLFKFLF